MYKSIMVPVDLAHIDSIEKALQTAADLAKHYGATVHYVAVTAPTPSEIAHNPAEFAEKLKQFADGQSSKHGIEAKAKPMTSHDPAIDLDDTLREAGDAVGADLVVMASHTPGFAEHIFSSNAGYLASHATISVFVVR